MLIILLTIHITTKGFPRAYNNFVPKVASSVYRVSWFERTTDNVFGILQRAFRQKVYDAIGLTIRGFR